MATEKWKILFLFFYCLKTVIRKPANVIKGIKFLKGVNVMSVYAYAGATYLGTAVISLVVIGIIVLLNKAFGGSSNNGEGVE